MVHLKVPIYIHKRRQTKGQKIDLKGPHDLTKQQVKQIGSDYLWVLPVSKGPIGLINNPWGGLHPLSLQVSHIYCKVFFLMHFVLSS